MTVMMESTAASKLVRFRQLMDAKKLNDEASTTMTPSPSSLEGRAMTMTAPPRSATASSSAYPHLVAMARPMTDSTHKSSVGAKSWPLTKETRSTHRDESVRGRVSLNLYDELEQEHQIGMTTNNDTTPNMNNTVAVVKENHHPNNLTAMKQIMRRKQLANAARKEMDDYASVSDEKKSEEVVVNQEEDGRATAITATPKATTEHELNITEFLNGESISLDEKDTSAWALLGNHLNETTLDNTDSSLLSMQLLDSSEVAISPAHWKQGHHDGARSQSLSSNNSNMIGSGDGASGVSGVLSFLGESPLFDQTISEENEAERNLCRSAEKVKWLEEHLLRSANAGGEGILSPVQPSRGGGDNDNDGNDNVIDEEENGSMLMMGREKEVTFAIQDGWETPRGISYSKYAKSPYVKDDDQGGGMTTPCSKMRLSESMEAQVNPMNESVIVSDGSDDEASGGDNNVVGSPSPMKGIGSDGGTFEGDQSENDFDTLGSSISPDVEMLGSLVGEQRHRRSSSRSSKQAISPTRASLMERNHTLVKEVRFADQTCVELSERKKYYKLQVGQYKKNLAMASKENSLVQGNYELSLQESAKLNVLVESLQAQKNQADLQVEAYRAQITDAEQTHRSSMKKMEKTYHSHLKNSEEQINSLNERLHQSLAANTNLQSKLDEVHGKWESKLQSDAASTELISSLKERVATGDATASNADASVQAMQTRITNLQGMCDQQKNQVQRERNEREMIEHDRDDLQQQCDSLHRQLTQWVQTSDTLGDVFFNEDGSRNEDFVEELKEYTPVKQLRLDSSSSAGADHPRTPTSNLLARTLRSELKRRQSVADKLEHAQHQVASLNDKISDMRMDIEEAKADNALIEEDLEEKCIQIHKLEETLQWKEDQVVRLNEEVVVLCQGGGTSSVAGDVESSHGESQSQSQRDTVSVLEERLDAVEETLEFADEELTETKARLADTQELLGQTAGELERSEEELAETRDEVSDYESQVENLLEALSEKEAEHANITKFSDFQTSTLDTMKDKLSQSDRVNAELRTQLKSCFQSLVALEKILRTYEDLDGIAGRMMTEQSRKVARLLETMQQFVQERSVSTTRDLESGALAESGSASQSMSSSSSLDAKSSDSVESYYEQLLDELREEVAAVKMERDDANEQLQKAQNFLQEFRDELSKQESEHAQETTSLTNQCNELEAKLSSVTSDLKAYQNENQSLSRAAAAAENGVSQQMSVIRGNNSDLIKENETLRVSLQSFELQLQDEKALLRSTREEADGYRHNVSNAKAAFECLTTECDLTKVSLTKLEKKAKGLRESETQKAKELKECQESLSSAQTMFQEQNESLKSRCDEVEAKLSVEEKGRVSAEASLDDASKHIAMLKDAIKSKEEESQEKQSECQELIIHVKQIQNALGEAERERTEADGTIERLESEIQEKKSILFAYEESIISYKDDIRRLKNELETTVIEKNNRIQMLEQACNSRQTLFTEQLDRTKKERDASTAELTEMIERLQDELQSCNRSHQESGERAKLSIKELEEEVLEQNEAQRVLEEEIIRNQTCINEETQKYHGASQELEEAQNEIARVLDNLNSMEMDCERMSTKHQDEMEELLDERNRVEGEKNQLEEQMRLFQANIVEVQELSGQKGHEITQLSAQNVSLQKKCNIFKDKVKLLNEKNRAWEGSYKAQSDDLVMHGDGNITIEQPGVRFEASSLVKPAGF